MKEKSVFTIINEQTGNLAFKLLFFDDNSHFDYLQRDNNYILVWINTGKGKLRTDFSEYEIKNNTMFAFAPYQPFMVTSEECKGIAVYFHSDFFCIHKHQTEVTCNGVLFNNVHQSPIFSIDKERENVFANIIKKVRAEISNRNIAQYEMLISYIKILLITASRIKNEQHPIKPISSTKEPEILQLLKDTIEQHYKKQHSPATYAMRLNISQKALAKLVKKHYNKTFKQLIVERILIETKRELYLTSKAVKEISYEMGFEDEHYFSRFFKKNTSISPQQYRETVGFGKTEM